MNNTTNYWSRINSGNNNGSAIGSVAFLVILIPIVIGAALSSLLVALVLPKYIKAMEPDTPDFKFWEAFKILFKTIVLFEALTFILIIVMPTSASACFDFLVHKPMDYSGAGFPLLVQIILYQLPVVLLTAAWLSYKLPPEYPSFKGTRGYLHTVIVTLLLIMPIVLLINYILSTIFYYCFQR